MNKQEWTIKRNWQQWIYKTQDEDKQNEKHSTENKSHVSIQMHDSLFYDFDVFLHFFFYLY
jgi:hypothetical protein